MNKILEKWNPIFDILKVEDSEKRIKMSEYAEHHIKTNEKNMVSSLNSVGDTNLLPISLNILKELNNFEITNDPSEVETREYSISVGDRIDVATLENVQKLESVLMHKVIEDLKDKNILIHSLVDELSVINEKDSGVRLILKSRIKIR